MDREKVGEKDAFCRSALFADVNIRLQVPIGACPVNQTLLDLVTHATNPLRLASMDPSLLPWL